jgi:hypothetical protein
MKYMSMQNFNTQQTMGGKHSDSGMLFGSNENSLVMGSGTMK